MKARAAYVLACAVLAVANVARYVPWPSAWNLRVWRARCWLFRRARTLMQIAVRGGWWRP